jgi:glycosyltransferase involved in cell wall biosynthesis
MKIGIACTNALPFPVPHNEIYANQDLAGNLADELATAGHDVTLFAPEGSRTKAQLATFGMLPFSDPRIYERYRDKRSFSDYENLFMAKIYDYAEREKFDLLHMHLRPLSVTPFAAMSPVPTLATIHDPLDFPYFKMLELYDGFPNLSFSSISLSQRRAMPELPMLANVYDGIDLRKWKFDPEGGERFCHAGRVIREKGVHRAMDLAKKLGVGFDIAGFVYDADRHDGDSYWNREVAPRLGGDVTLEYIPQERLPAFYGKSKAFLNTLDWEEPFGLVMVEAMACGTPVIAFDRGSVREVVKDGVTGFVVKDEAEMIEAIREVGKIRRADCRRHAEENFSLGKMAEDYLKAYEKLLARKEQADS